MVCQIKQTIGIQSHLMTGNTPVVKIHSLSNALGVQILGKAEVWLSLHPVIVQLTGVTVLESRWKRERPGSPARCASNGYNIVDCVVD